jgi:hypothetical protein
MVTDVLLRMKVFGKLCRRGGQTRQLTDRIAPFRLMFRPVGASNQAAEFLA